MTKVAVFGNRTIDNDTLVLKTFAGWIKENNLTPPLILLHGGANGPQAIVKDVLVEKLGWEGVLFKPWHMIWSKLEFKPIFFYLRNKQIVENADKIVVFDNGEQDSEVYRVIALCEKREKDLTVIKV